MRRISANGTSAVVDAPIQTGTTPKRMVLSAVKKYEASNTEKIVLYAPEGWGKSTWAAKAEKPIFISTEEGLKGVDPVPDTFPEAQTWQDIFDSIETLRSEPHDYKTLVLDTADWAEVLCHKHMLQRDSKDSIEDYGYGKGLNLAFEEWQRLKMPLDSLRREKSMNIIVLAHCSIKTFNNPGGDNYDRYELKTDKRISALLKEWADHVLFGNYDVSLDVNKTKAGKTIGKAKAYGGAMEDRVIHANHTASWDGKNRYRMEDPFSADPVDFWNLAKGGIKQ